MGASTASLEKLRVQFEADEKKKLKNSIIEVFEENWTVVLIWLEIVASRMFRYATFSGEIIGIDWQQTYFNPLITDLSKDADIELWKRLRIFESVSIPIINEK